MNTLPRPSKADVWHHSESKHHFYTLLSALIVTIYLAGVLLSLDVLKECRYVTPVLPVIWLVVNLRKIHWKNVLEDLTENPTKW